MNMGQDGPLPLSKGLHGLGAAGGTRGGGGGGGCGAAAVFGVTEWRASPRPQ